MHSASELAFRVAEATESRLVGWRVQRLREALEAPLVVVATGATAAAAELWARLHRAAGQPAWAMGPYDYVESAAPPGAHTLILSVRGRHHDLLHAAAVAMARGPTRAVTCDRRAPLCTMVRDGGHDTLVLPAPLDAADAGPMQLTSMLVLAARAYGGVGPWAPFFKPTPVKLPSKAPRGVFALGAGLARPAARHFAWCLGESGVPATTMDLRDFAHGAFMAAKGLWVVGFATAEQRGDLSRAGEILRVPFMTFEADRPGVSGALQLFSQSLETVSVVRETFDLPGGRIEARHWGAELYHQPLERE